MHCWTCTLKLNRTSDVCGKLDKKGESSIGNVVCRSLTVTISPVVEWSAYCDDTLTVENTHIRCIWHIRWHVEDSNIYTEVMQNLFSLVQVAGHFEGGFPASGWTVVAPSHCKDQWDTMLCRMTALYLTLATTIICPWISQLPAFRGGTTECHKASDFNGWWNHCFCVQ